MVTAIRRDNIKIEIGTASESFLRITVLKDQMHLIIDFVNDLEFHYGGFEAADFFPKIDSWRNILLNGFFLLIRKFWIKSSCKCMMTFSMADRIRW